jgi:hypothetical protein
LILNELTQRVTSNNLRAAARKFLRDDQYIEAKLTPAPAAPAPAAPAAPPPPAAAAPTALAPSTEAR